MQPFLFFVSPGAACLPPRIELLYWHQAQPVKPKNWMLTHKPVEYMVNTSMKHKAFATYSVGGNFPVNPSVVAVPA